jgi:hypothetical protein
VQGAELAQCAAIYKALTTAQRAHWFARVSPDDQFAIVARARKPIQYAAPLLQQFYLPVDALFRHFERGRQLAAALATPPITVVPPRPSRPPLVVVSGNWGGHIKRAG